MANLAVAVACSDPILGARAVWLPGVADHSAIATSFRVRASRVWCGAFPSMRNIFPRVPLNAGMVRGLRRTAGKRAKQ